MHVRVSAEGGGSVPTPPPAHPGPSFAHRHRVALIVTAVIVMVVASGAGFFVYQWNHSGPHQVSSATAYQRFRSGITGAFVDPGTLRPHEGVYSYRGSGHEHISLPPKSQVEGPGIPGTVSYQSDGCWVWRLDYSDSHWQNATLLRPRRQPGRGGPCRVVPMELRGAVHRRYRHVQLFARGRHSDSAAGGTAVPLHLHWQNPIKTGVVTMKGTENRYVGPQTLRIAGTDVTALHFREVSTFSGGQGGTNVADTWFSTVNGLPLKGTWSTKVSSPTFLGTSTLVGGASFTLQSLTPRS